MNAIEGRLPVPDDFAEPPSTEDVERWLEADRLARPRRIERIRARLDREGLDAYFSVRRENIRYLTGFSLGEGEEKVAGHSGQTLVARDEIVVLADSRYSIQARREAPEARIEPVLYDLPDRWKALVSPVGARRVGVEAAFVSHALWGRL